MNDSETTHEPTVSERDLDESRLALRSGVRLGIFSIFGLLFLSVFLMLASGASASPLPIVGSTVGGAVVLAVFSIALVALGRWSWRV